MTSSASKAKPAGNRPRARVIAIRAILDWETGTVPTIDAALPAAGDQDAALARELALGAVAWRRLYRTIAARYLRPGRQPRELLIALDVIAHQLFALDRIPPHAAVGEGVEALHRLGCRGLMGVANAVGRRLATLRMDRRTMAGPLGRIPPDAQPAGLGDRLSLPELLIEHVRPVLPGGVDHLERDLTALTVMPPLCTRNRPGGPVPTGSSIIRRDGPWTWWDDPAEALEWVRDGAIVVQDRSQGAAVDLAGIRPGELVLDLCAAPGGKSVACTDRGARVIAADRQADKVHDLATVLPRRVLVQDGTMPAVVGGFDVVLVDAPCSNSGVLARRVEARWRYDRAHLSRLVALQRRLIESGSRLVATGGRLIYSTCSLAPEENQGIAHRLDGWRVLAEHCAWPDGWQMGGYACVLVRS